MHLFRILLINLTERIFQCILIYPYGSSQFIALKIPECALVGLLIGIGIVLIADDFFTKYSMQNINLV